MIKQFLKTSIKLESTLNTINEDYLLFEKPKSQVETKLLNALDKKILITNFYVNTIIKMLIYDLRDILIKALNP